MAVKRSLFWRYLWNFVARRRKRWRSAGRRFSSSIKRLCDKFSLIKRSLAFSTCSIRVFKIRTTLFATSLCRTTVIKAPTVRFCNLAIFFHRDAFFFSSFTYVSPSLFMVGRFLSAMFYALAIPSHKRLFIYLYCPFTRHCSRPLFKRRFNLLISPFVGRPAGPYSLFKRPWNLSIALFIRRRLGPYSLFKRSWNLLTALFIRRRLGPYSLFKRPWNLLIALFKCRRLGPHSLFKRPRTLMRVSIDYVIVQLQ